MRTLLSIAAALLAAHAGPVAGAEPSILWQAAAFASSSGALVPAKRPAAVDPAGNLIVVATQAGSAGGCIVTIKYSGGEGGVAWRRESCGAGGAGAGVAVDRGGNAIVAGHADGELRLLKYSPSGTLLWEQRYAPGSPTSAHGVAIDPSGNVFVLAAARAFTIDLWIAKRRGDDGSLMWQQPVEGGADIVPTGLAVDGGGNALVAGTYRNARGDDDWHLAKLAGSSGAVLWRKVYDSGGNDTADALAVDAVGHITVVGSSAVGRTAPVIRTVKSESATGRAIWEQSYSASGRAGARAVAIDGGGNVIVTGFVSAGPGGDDIKTLKYAEHDGALLWHATHGGSGVGAEAGSAVAVDGAGDVLVAGRGYGSSAEIRTLKYAGANGAALWSAALPVGAASAEESSHGVVAAGRGVFVVGAVMEGQGAGLRAIKYADAPASTPAAPASLNVQGLWWRGPAESGWGLNLTQQGDILFATWFTYDENGHPLWLVMSEGRHVGGNTYEGTLHRTSGPAFHAVPFDPARVNVQPVGRATLRFADADHGTFEYEVGSVRQSKPIERQVFSGPVPQCAQGGGTAASPNYQDLWWARAGAESGWGLNIAHQGDVLFVTWFTYGPDGRGMWLVGSNVARTGNATYRGTLYRTAGQPFSAQPWSAERVGIVAAGQVTLDFADASSGLFTYSLDGVTQTKAIARQVYATPKTICR